MTFEETRRVSDFTIKVIMIFTTILALLYFTTIFNQLIINSLLLLFLLALIAKGISDFVLVRRKNK